MAYDGMDNAMTNAANKHTGLLRRFGLSGALIVAACLATGATFLGYGVDANLPWPVTSNTTIAAKHCQGTILAGTGSTGQFTLTLPAVTGFPANCSVLIKNGDSTANKTLSGFPTTIGSTLLPQGTAGVKIINGGWAGFYTLGLLQPGQVLGNNGTTLAPAAPITARIQLPGQNFYVNGSPSATATCGQTGASTCSAGSDSNNCLTPGTACLTLQHVANLILSSYDFAGTGNNVNLAHNVGSTVATNYVVSCGGPVIGAVSIAVRGDDNATTAVQIQAPDAGNAVTLTNLCLITFTSVEFIDSPSHTAQAYISIGGGHNPVHTDLLRVTFAGCSVCAFVNASYSGTAAFVGGDAITGGAPQAFQVSGGTLDFGFAPFSVSNNLTFGTFAGMTSGAVVTGINSSTFGSPTGIIGTRCVIVGSPITLGNLPNPNTIFPGNSDCIINTLVGAIAVQNGSGGSSNYNFGTAGQPLLSGGGGTSGAPNGDNTYATLGVPGGGTGNATAAAHSIPVSEGAGAQNAVGPCTTSQVIVGQGSSADPACGGVPAAALPNPSASTLGGIESMAALAHNWIAAIDTSGVPHQSQPATTDLSDVTAPTSWTAADASGAGLSLTTSDTVYTKIGKACTVSFAITYPTTANSSNAQIGGVPVACAARNGTLNYVASGAIFGYITAANAALQTNGQSLFILSQGGGVLTNANLSGLTIRGTITYITN
jgi:hypothetical protein